jgi:LysM repeat protein
MQSLRQLGGGVIIAIISVLLVIGGISLALSENLVAQATPTPIPPTLSLHFPTATFTPSPVFAETTTATLTATLVFPTDTPFATNTLFVQASCVLPSGWIPVVVSTNDSVYSLAQRYKTTPENLGTANCLSSFDVPVGYTLYVPPVPTVTVIPCGPLPGYVRRYVVQRGDTLYSVATLYRISYPTLQRANCMGSSTTIYAGQVLWVPNIIIPTRYPPTPGVTVIPTFPKATNTSIPVPPTEPPTEPPPTEPLTEPPPSYQ